MKNHLTDREVSLFLEHQLSPEHQSSLEQHLSGCQDCCEQIASSHRMMSAVIQSDVPQLRSDILQKAERLVRTATHNKTAWGMGSTRIQFAFALILVMFIGVTAYWQPWKDEQVVYRSGETALSIELQSPVEGELVSLTPIEFSWSALQEAVQYQFYLMNEQGEVISKQITTEPKLKFQQVDLLEKEKTYHWQVDAIMMEGSVVSSESASFTYLP